MMQPIIPPTQSNSNFLRVADKIRGALPGQPSLGEFMNGYKYSDDTLILLQALSPAQTQYKFNPVRGLDSTVPTARLMDKSDLFAVTGVGIIFSRATYSSVTGALSNFGNYEIYTYPFAQVFTGTNEQAGLLNIVRGTTALSVNADQQWQLPNNRLVFKNAYINAQPTTITYGGGGPASEGIHPLDAIIILDGQNQIELTVDLATGGTLTNIDGNTNATTRNVLGVVLDGFRVRNVANGGFTALNCRL